MYVCIVDVYAYAHICMCVYIYIYTHMYMRGHQKGVEQKGVLEHKQPNSECVCVCVQIHLKHQNGVSHASKVYVCTVTFWNNPNPHEIHSAKKRA